MTAIGIDVLPSPSLRDLLPEPPTRPVRAERRRRKRYRNRRLWEKNPGRGWFRKPSRPAGKPAPMNVDERDRSLELDSRTQIVDEVGGLRLVDVGHDENYEPCSADAHGMECPDGCTYAEPFGEPQTIQASAIARDPDPEVEELLGEFIEVIPTGFHLVEVAA